MTMPTTSTKNYRTTFLATATFLFGVVGTAAMMTLLKPSSAPPAASRPNATQDPPGNMQESEAASEGAANTVALSPEGKETVGIRVATVRDRVTRESLAVPGTVEAVQGRVAKVTPPVAGKVVRVLVRVGDSVRAGQTLAVLDSYEVAQAHAAERDALARVQQAEAALATATTAVGQARGRQASVQKALATQRALARAGAFSQAPLQAAQSELSEAQSELIAAQTELQTHEAVYQRTERLFKEGIAARAEMEQARLEREQDRTRVTRAQARTDIAKSALARERRVSEAGLLNRQAVQSAEAEVRAAGGEVARAVREQEAARTALLGARQAVTAARANLAALEGVGHVEGEGGRIALSAPISGIVSDVDATLGETIERSGALFQVEDLGAVVVQAHVAEKDIARVRIGQSVTGTVPAFPHEPFRGVVQSLASRLDEKTRALPVRCLVSNPSRHLRPEMFASVSLSVGEVRRALVVPAGAMVSDRAEGGSEQQVIFVERDKAGQYEKRAVVRGGEFGGNVEVMAGLKEGERIVVAGAYTLLAESKKAELSEE